MSAPAKFYLADQPEDFARLGIDPAIPARWEDGSRISTEPGNLEWWYFDTHLDDGTVMVIVFYGRSPFAPTGPFTPILSVNLDLPDGTKISKTYNGRADEYSAATDHCDVRIGANRFVGDLANYRISVEIDDLRIDVDLKATVPSFRQDTSHSYFRKSGGEKMFAWFVAVPEGEVTVRYSIGGVERTGTGYGYHDHNWGDAPMWQVMNDWYWARAKIGPYTVIAAYVTAGKDYGFEDQINFMLARDGRVVASGMKPASFATDQVHQDLATGKPVADVIRFDFVDEGQAYAVTFKREETILSAKMADQLPRLKRWLARLVGFSGAYLRFRGQATLEVAEANRAPETHQAEAVWELMYFGKARAPVR